MQDLPALIDVKAVRRITGLSSRKLWELRVAGAFPAARDLGPRSTRWKTAEVLAWVDALPAAPLRAEPERLAASPKGRRLIRHPLTVKAHGPRAVRRLPTPQGTTMNNNKQTPVRVTVANTARKPVDAARSLADVKAGLAEMDAGIARVTEQLAKLAALTRVANAQLAPRRAAAEHARLAGTNSERFASLYKGVK